MEGAKEVGELTHKNRIGTSTLSGNFSFNGKNINFKAKWVEFSFDDLPEKHKNIFKGYLLTLVLGEK